MPFDETTGVLTSLPLTKERRAVLLAQVRDHYEEAEQGRGDWPTRHERRYRRLLADRNLRSRGAWLNAPRIFTPDTQNVFDKLLSKLAMGVFPRFEALEMEPRDEQAMPNLDKALRTERWVLRYLINDADNGGFAYICRMAIFDALLDSAGFLKVYPWRQPWTDAIPERLIRMDNVDEGMLLIPPGATGLQYPEAAYVGHDVHVRWDDLMRLKKDGYTVPAHDDFPAEQKHLTERQRAEQERDGRQAEQGSGDYLVNEMYERFVIDPKENEEEDEVIVSWYPHASTEHALGRVILLKDRFPFVDHPRRPFFPIVVWQHPRQLRGLNVVDKVSHYQDLINRYTEQSVGYGDISLAPMFLYDAMLTGEMPDLTQVEPGQGVPVNNTGAVQFVPRGSLNQHFAQQLTEQRVGIERSTAVSDATQGVSPSRPNAPRTASGTAMLRQAAQEAFSTLVGILGVQFQAPLQFHWQLMQHYAPPDLKVPLRRASRRQAPTVRPSGIGIENPGGALDGLAASAPAPAPSPSLQPEDETADALLTPEEPFLLETAVGRDDLEGTFMVKLKVNPDLPFDRQTITQMGQFLYPILAAKYPLGARALLKKMWTVNNQEGFDTMYPPSIALIETHALFSQIVKQTQAQDSGPPSEGAAEGQGGPQLPPEVQALQHAHAASEAQHGMRQHAHQTQAHQTQAQIAQVKLLAEIQKVLAAADAAQPQGSNGAGGGRGE